jgi:hypothetical protein
LQEKRKNRLMVSFTNTELAELESHANGVPTPIYIRAVVLGGNAASSIRSIPEINRQAYAELARLAANLNQLQHKLNSPDGFAPAPLIERMQPIVIETLQVLQQVRTTLLGGGN